MGPGFSTYLNVLRFGAAMVVLLSHFAYPRFSDGVWIWIRDLNLGSDAVVLFFVLSGFVIALTAERKDANLNAFAFARATRIISVALPALVLGWMMDQRGSVVAPSEYVAPFYSPLPLWEMLLRGLSFSNEWSGMTARLGSNGPFWSLSYEVAYYIMFGIAFFMTGLRRSALLLVVIAVVGLNVLLLMPAWLVGVALYHKMKTGQTLRTLPAFLCAAIPVFIYALALWLDLPAILQTTIQPDLPGHALRFSDEYLWNAILGVLVGIHLTGAASLLRGWNPTKSARPAAWLAGASFSIYLMHYPLLHVIHATLPGLGQAGLFGLTLLACFAFAEVFERPLHRWRRLLISLAHIHRPRVAG